MNHKCFLTIALCAIICGRTVAQTQDVDTALSDLSGKIAASIKEHSNKKVTVVDFTDLEGASSELGRYVAEQLTVNLVMEKREFAVLDRANLKRILAELKLTSDGLVDPQNAKKLGSFAGVDALILGNIMPKGTNIGITAKIITTETAEIVGAARTEFKSDATVSNLLSRPALPTDPNQPPPQKPFGDLDVKVESLKVVSAGPNASVATLTLIFTNSSPSKTYGVAVNPDYYHTFNLSNSRGDEFQAYKVDGIETAYDNGNGGFYGRCTDVLPRNSITVVAKSQIIWNGSGGDYRPYRLQTVIVFGEEENGRHPNLKKFNLVLDIK